MGSIPPKLDHPVMEKVLWSDESKFEIFGENRWVYARRYAGERFKLECLVQTVKHRGGNVMVWGCFMGEKVGDLMRINGIVDQKVYHSILQRHLVPSGKRLCQGLYIFQQDNDPKHTSNLCKFFWKV